MNINFVRYDPNTGKILSSGQMLEAHIDMLNARGDTHLKLTEPLPTGNFKVDLETLTVVPDAVIVSFEEEYDQLKGIIYNELAKTDYTQAADALDHLTVEKQEEWRVYRAAIRNAQNAPTFDEAVDLLPVSDPKGNDPYTAFKIILESKRTLDTLAQNAI